MGSTGGHDVGRSGPCEMLCGRGVIAPRLPPRRCHYPAPVAQTAVEKVDKSVPATTMRRAQIHAVAVSRVRSTASQTALLTSRPIA